ncbi:MAG: hypothetical protein NVSMB9_13130 [Isosphaeraceae bacterium]
MIGSRAGNAPWGMVAALLAVSLIEAGIARRDLDLLRPDCLNWRQAQRAATRKAPGREVLCLGTSMVQEGVFPQVIEKHTGKRTQNLAICASQPCVSYYALRRALAAGARPSAVLIDFHPTMLRLTYKEAISWPDALGFWDYLDMCLTVRDPQFMGSTALAKILPSVYHRGQIQKAVLAALQGQPLYLFLGNLHYLRNISRNDGALITVRNPDYRGEVSDEFKQKFLQQEFRCDPQGKKDIRRFLRLASDHGIRVYWLVMPLAPALQAGREALGQDAAYTRFVYSFLDDPNLVVLDGRRSGYDHTLFKDACHLDPQGAFVFSEGVARVLRGHDRRGVGTSQIERWVNLPAYREHPIDVPIETMLQTQIALRPVAAALRR